MMRTFDRAFLLRSCLVSLALSATAGGIGYLVELYKLDNLAKAVALAELRRLRPELDAPSPPTFRADTDEPVRRLVQENCVLLRLYDAHGRLRTEVTDPSQPFSGQDLAAAVKGLPAPGPMRVRRVELLGRPAVLLRMPVDGSRAWAKGRLEAVFLINPQDVLLLKSYIERITFTAMGAVLATALLLYPVFRSLHQRVVRLLEDAVRSNLETASVLGAAIAVRDSDTGSHNFRVALYALRMGETLGEGSLDMVSLILGAFLHDVGKIGIRDEILLKPGPLTEAETLVMRTHVQRGLDIIGSSQWLQLARRVVGGHHERFDGTGYPAGLKGEDIPLEARIFAIIDVFDALTSQRPYHRAMGFEEAMALLEGQAGRHFDPVLLAAFQRVAREAHRDLGAATEAELMERLMKEVDRRRPELYAAEMVSTATPAGWGPQLPLPSLDLTRPVTK